MSCRKELFCTHQSEGKETKLVHTACAYHLGEDRGCICEEYLLSLKKPVKMDGVKIKIPAHKLDSDLIKDIQEKYGDAELEITINRKPDFTPLKEEEFWKLIELLDWEKENDEEIIKPLVTALSQLPTSHIYHFQEILSEKLYLLDQQKYAENIGRFSYSPDTYFSADHFLHVRSCVIANGKEAYEEVLAKPDLMFKDISFEALLTVASKAFTEKTGKAFIYVPFYNIETFSKKEGWE